MTCDRYEEWAKYAEEPVVGSMFDPVCVSGSYGSADQLGFEVIYLSKTREYKLVICNRPPDTYPDWIVVAVLDQHLAGWMVRSILEKLL